MLPAAVAAINNMLYIHTVMKAAITRLPTVGIRPAKNELAGAPRIADTQRFISGIENYVEGKQIREVAQTWMVNLS